MTRIRPLPLDGVDGGGGGVRAYLACFGAAAPDPRDGELLTTAERARAARLPAPAAREFTARRAALRRVLAGHLGCGAAEVPIGVEPGGRPVLLGAAAEWSFSVSGTGTVAVFAVGREVRPAVDVERLISADRRATLARVALHASERDWLDAVPEPDRDRAFTEVWTAKECYAKLAGVPLLQALGEARLVPGAVALVARDRRFTVHSLPFGRSDDTDDSSGLVGSLLVDASGMLR